MESRCAFERLGDGIVNLPQDERTKFMLEDRSPAERILRRELSAGCKK
jgi:hypothetical protein